MKDLGGAIEQADQAMYVSRQEAREEKIAPRGPKTETSLN
jgi:hypothetical protein